MPRTKYTNPVLARNGGLDSTRTLRLLEQVLTTHDLKQAVLYQFILTGSDHKPTYQSAIKALMKHIRSKCRAEYIGGYEVGEEKGGLHAHMYVVIETARHFPSDLLDVREGGFLARLISRKNKGTDPATDKQFGIRIEPPKNAMHGRQMFARLNTPDKVVDAIKWASYGLKRRSKDAVPGRETYFGSEFTSNITKREAQRQKHRDALHIAAAPAAHPGITHLNFQGSYSDQHRPTHNNEGTHHETVPTPQQPSHTDATSASASNSASNSTRDAYTSRGQSSSRSSIERPRPGLSGTGRQRQAITPVDQTPERQPRCQKSTDSQHPTNTPVLPVRKIGVAISNSTVYSNTH